MCLHSVWFSPKHTPIIQTCPNKQRNRITTAYLSHTRESMSATSDSRLLKQDVLYHKVHHTICTRIHFISGKTSSCLIYPFIYVLINFGDRCPRQKITYTDTQLSAFCDLLPRSSPEFVIPNSRKSYAHSEFQAWIILTGRLDELKNERA